jgi:hypothetical protein
MKDNLGPSKDLLLKALRSLPQDFVLREARHHISQAIRKLENVEDRRMKRATQQRQAIPTTPNLPFYPAETLDIIDRMIDDEGKKLEEIKAQKEKKYDSESESGTIFG